MNMGIDNYEIVGLEWERIFLHIRIRSNVGENLRFALCPVPGKESEHGMQQIRLIPLQAEYIGDSMCELVINMAAADGRSFLENGIWKLQVYDGSQAFEPVVASEIAYDLDSKSRIFPYGGQKYSYNVFFSLDSREQRTINLRLHSCFMQINSGWKKKRYLSGANSVGEKAKGLFKCLAVLGIRTLYGFFDFVYPKRGHKILFMSETKENPGGNLKYIEERMKVREMEKEYKISDSFRNSVSQRCGLRSWIRTLRAIAESDFIFVDDYAPVFGYLRLSDKTKLTQVWHAGEGFKSVGYSRFGKEGSPEPAQSCHKAYDYVAVGSEKLIHVYEEVFGIEKQAFLPTGMPRLDDFLDKEKIERVQGDIYRKYPQIRGKKVILFAPTFRGTGQKEAYYDHNQLDLERIYQFCGEEFLFCIKLHPFIKEKMHIPENYTDRILDLTQYPNINELYYVTDILITDYSSNYYEYALLKKPVVFFTYDREHYELLHGVHRSVKEFAPGKVCDSFEELMAALENGDFELEKMEQFVKNNFSGYDGHACDRIIDRVIYGRNDTAFPREQ